MAITQALCESFRVDLLSGGHNFNTSNRALTLNTQDSFKVALYTSSATLGATTTNYTNNTGNEVANGNGYTTGGGAITINQVPTGTTTAWLDFTDTAWASATFTARGALIYNNTNATKSVGVLEFGTDKSVDNGTFTIVWPPGDATNAIIRIA